MLNFMKKILKFLQDVANDPVIPERDKKILLALIALIISPIDLIPDWIPFVGMIDDYFLLCLILDYFFTVLDQDVLLKHYPWGMKSFIALKKLSKLLSRPVPRFLKKRLWKYVGSPY